MSGLHFGLFGHVKETIWTCSHVGCHRSKACFDTCVTSRLVVTKCSDPSCAQAPRCETVQEYLQRSA